MLTRTCPQCGINKPQAEFHRNKNTPDGCATQCKACRSNYFKTRQKKHTTITVSKKRCVRCDEVKSALAFGRSNTNKTGLHSYCRWCLTAYFRESGGYVKNRVRFKMYKQRKLDYVRQRKVEKGCMDCGDRREPVLEFHHRDPSQKTMTVNRLCARATSIKKLDAEMAKCDVLCSNCHRMRHYHERQATQKTA